MIIHSAIRLGIAIGVLLLVAGCYITRKGEICSITMPQAYCDRDLYNSVTKPGTTIEKWSLIGRTTEARLKDWMECGGTSGGRYGIEVFPDGESRTSKEIQRDSDDLSRQTQRCMLKKNYQYIGECYDNKISRSLPACGAP